MKNTVGRENYMRKVERAKVTKTVGMPRHEMVLFFFILYCSILPQVAAMLGMVSIFLEQYYCRKY